MRIAWDQFGLNVVAWLKIVQFGPVITCSTYAAK